MSDYSTVGDLPEVVVKPRTVDELEPVKPAEWKGETADKLASSGRMGAIMHAFGQGFEHEWGSAKFGPELKQYLEDQKILYNGDGNRTVAKAFNEAFLRPAVNGLDVGLRTLTGTLKGLGDAAVEAGIPKDIIGMTLENPLFAGGTGLMGKYPKYPGGKPRYTGGAGDTVDLRVAKDLDVIGPTPEPPLAAPTAAEAAERGVKPITAYHGSPYSFDAFKSEAIGTGEGAQSYGHGIYVAEHPEVAKSYAPSKDFDQQGHFADTVLEAHQGNRLEAIEGLKQELAKATEPDWIATAKDALKRLEAGYTGEGHHYQVKIHADKNAMLDWDKPLSEQPKSVQDALAPLIKLMEEDSEGVWNHQFGKTDYKKMTGQEFQHRMMEFFDSDTGQSVSQALHEAGIPGIKYLDQGSRNVQELPRNTPGGWQVDWHGPNEKTFPWDEYGGDRAAYDAAKKYADELRGQPTHNLVVFDERDIEITHRNGEPVAKNVPEPTPQSMPAIAKDNSLVKRGETALAPADVNPWKERFNEWVQKLQVPDDVKNLIRNASEDNNTFPEARAGQIPEQHLGALSDATGIPRDQLPEAQLRQTFKNDAEFRTAAQLMIQTNDDVFNAAREHKGQPTFESRKALVAAIMRRDLALESVLGLRAEWGRTGNVMQEFLDSIKDAQGLGKFIKDKKGGEWNSAKLDEIADKLSALPDREAQGRFLTDARKPDFLDKLIWYWTNALLSGPFTHGKYIIANAAYLAHDTLIATPMAGVSGLLRRDADRVYLGETAAKVYGLIAGVPDAIRASGQAMKTNMPTPLPAQMAGAGKTNAVTGISGSNPFSSTVGRAAGEVMGIPSRGISGIHSFFNFLGYRAELEAQGYRQAVKDGHSPLTKDFWRAQYEHAAFPDDPAMDAAVQAGAKANFVQDLGPSGKAVQNLMYQTRLGRFVMPFLKVPGNIFNAVQEGTPFAFLDTRMRNDLIADGPAGDMARGRMMGGAAIMGTAAYWTLQDKVTGHGPIDPKERAQWLLTHQPNSVQIGGQWVSYNQFGPIGGWLALSSDLTDTAALIQRSLDDKQITAADADRHQKNLVEAYSRTVVGFTHWFEEAGFTGLFNIINAMDHPDKTRASNAGSTAASMLPFSSAQRQVAGFNDPYMRDAQTFIDGIRNAIPGQRETLPVARDWTGAPRLNPAHHSIMRQEEVRNDPIDQEMQRLDLKPTKPSDQIKGVKLTREQYDEYQTIAGMSTRSALQGLISKPGWEQIPPFARSKLILTQITASRHQAEAIMQAKYPNLIQEAIDNKQDILRGTKPVPKAYQRPE